MMLNEKLKSRLEALLQLAKRGVGGEAENADEMLNRLLEKHGCTIDDVADERKEKIWFNIKSNDERQIVFQIIFKILDENTCGFYRLKKMVGVELTKAQAIQAREEIPIFLSAFRAEKKKIGENFISAFVHKNELFSTSSEGSNGESRLTIEELECIRAMADGMKKTEVLKTIEDRSLCATGIYDEA